MKLVTHCQSGNEDIVFKEYLIYKLYNVLTDSSFRVRLIKNQIISIHSSKASQSDHMPFL